MTQAGQRLACRAPPPPHSTRSGLHKQTITSGHHWRCLLLVGRGRASHTVQAIPRPLHGTSTSPEAPHKVSNRSAKDQHRASPRPQKTFSKGLRVCKAPAGPLRVWQDIQLQYLPGVILKFPGNPQESCWGSPGINHGLDEAVVPILDVSRHGLPCAR